MKMVALGTVCLPTTSLVDREGNEFCQPIGAPAMVDFIRSHIATN